MVQCCNSVGELRLLHLSEAIIVYMNWGVNAHTLWPSSKHEYNLSYRDSYRFSNPLNLQNVARL